MNNILSPTPPARMLASADHRIEAIRTAAGLPQEQFDARCLPVLGMYAQHVQNLPYAPKVFNRAEGAWEAGLICATVALQYAGTVIFVPEMKAEERRLLEPQFRYMSFVATVATCAARVTSLVKLEAADGEFHPFLTPARFHEWLLAHPDASFRWRDTNPGMSNQGCSVVAARLLPVGLFEHFDLRVVMMFHEAVTSGTQKLLGIESTLAKVVRESIARVTDHYAEKEAHAFQGSDASLLAVPLDTSALAKQMTAQANPTLPVNPLAPDGNAATAATASPAGTAPSVHDSNVGPVSPQPGAGLSTDAIDRPASSAVYVGGDPLQGKDQALKEWFQALKMHPRYPDLAKNIVSSAEGVQVPINMLGMFGVSSPTIRKQMENAGFVVRRSDDQRSLILIPALKDLIIQEAPIAA